MKIRKQQVLLWGVTIVVLVSGILINNYTINNKDLRVGEIESFMNRIFITNLLNSDLSYGPNCFDVTIGSDGIITNFGVLTVDGKKLEKIRFTKGEGYRNAGSCGGHSYVTQRGYVPYTDVDLKQIEDFVDNCIETYDLLPANKAYDTLKIQLINQMSKDIHTRVEEDMEQKTYIQASGETTYKKLSGDIIIPEGSYKFYVYFIDESDKASKTRIEMTFYKLF